MFKNKLKEKLQAGEKLIGTWNTISSPAITEIIASTGIDFLVIDFEHARVYDHSGLDAIHNITTRYGQYNKKVHLLNLSPECRSLLAKVDSVVEVSVIEDLNWQIADNRLG